MRQLAAAGLWLAAAGTARVPPDLTGRWTLDRARSESQLPVPDLTLDIVQHDSVVAIESRIRTPQGIRTVNDTAITSGHPAPYTFRRPTGQEGTGVRTARWSSSTGSLEIADSVLLDTPIGPMPRWTDQRWTLSDDGRTLTQEITLRQPFVRFNIKYVFARGDA